MTSRNPRLSRRLNDFGNCNIQFVGWMERSDTHHVMGVLANGHRTCSKVMGFASAQTILRPIFAAYASAFLERRFSAFTSALRN
jgi:hypothetical protein